MVYKDIDTLPLETISFVMGNAGLKDAVVALLGLRVAKIKPHLLDEPYRINATFTPL